ncbi:protein phosphatase CheZ [Siccirubricoccus sp. KC 17139]|uniref:Protein phosphatase CheZ n=1 Tax=Siccirubricoccus soli TaxID=2899147 RepID=A0ABT1D488_9PROT|nr:protein phosphatase CheZ [Siccirubricoccus soli]MCO6416739.1 protein phosphatase CheZ [Siccirubricoccus soli]MCP2682874.1 protein phosphatase CheZ [Siccirubricoccus soli]
MLLETSSPLPDQMRAGLRAELLPMFEELRSFLDRRIHEVSAEVAATVQLMDFSEENITGQLGKIHEQIVKLVAIPAANSRNSGLELEAVVQATEAAANTIMEAAEAIQDWISSGCHDSDSVRVLSDKVNSIFEACSFQDVTGQRIRRAIQHLQQVETMLEGIVPAIAAPPPEERLEVKQVMHTVPEAAKSSPDLAQEEIDRLLNG